MLLNKSEKSISNQETLVFNGSSFSRGDLQSVKKWYLEEMPLESEKPNLLIILPRKLSGNV